MRSCTILADQSAAASARPRSVLRRAGQPERYTPKSGACWSGGTGKIDQIARQNYPSYRYFGVSALGEAPTLAGRRRPRKVSPPRYSPLPSRRPLLWLLGRYGIIPVS